MIDEGQMTNAKGHSREGGNPVAEVVKLARKNGRLIHVRGVLYMPDELERSTNLFRAGKRELAQKIVEKVLAAQPERTKKRHVHHHRSRRS